MMYHMEAKVSLLVVSYFLLCPLYEGYYFVRKVELVQGRSEKNTWFSDSKELPFAILGVVSSQFVFDLCIQ